MDEDRQNQLQNKLTEKAYLAVDKNGKIVYGKTPEALEKTAAGQIKETDFRTFMRNKHTNSLIAHEGQVLIGSEKEDAPVIATLREIAITQDKLKQIDSKSASRSMRGLALRAAEKNKIADADYEALKAVEAEACGLRDKLGTLKKKLADYKKV